jgi:ribonuclease HIII
LRIIAKISSDVEMEDVLKLSEVSYVFLKYLKDYRMDLMQPEIQQIVKYIIFTFKMLLTSRRPEDFNVLVQYLNNPVKIFTDT